VDRSGDAHECLITGETEIAGQAVVEAVVDFQSADVFILEILYGASPDSDVRVGSGRDRVGKGSEQRSEDGGLSEGGGTERQRWNTLGRGLQTLGLPQTFVGKEEESAVLLNGAADTAAVLIERKRRQGTGIGEAAGIELGVTGVLEGGTVEGVGAR